MKEDKETKVVGRTIWDVIIASSYILGGLIFIVAVGFFLWFWLDEVPTWFYIAILGSLAFIPFLLERAKEDADLYLVADEPFQITEYRVGRKYGMMIEGNGTLFQSNSGVYRTLLTSFDPESKLATGSSFAELSQIDQVRDMRTLNNLSQMLEETLRENRISHQTVGIEVEKQSKVIVDWALKTIYGSLIPTEISEVFGVDEEEVEYEHQTVDELIDESDLNPYGMG